MPNQCAHRPTPSVLAVISSVRHQADKLLTGSQKSSVSLEGKADVLCQVPKLTLHIEWEGAVLYGYWDSTASGVDMHTL